MNSGSERGRVLDFVGLLGFGPVFVAEGLANEGGEEVVVISFPWGGMVSGDECRDDVDDGRGVKVETAALLLGLDLGLGGGVGCGGVWGALLGRGGCAGGARGWVGMGNMMVEEALEVVEGAVLWGRGGEGRGRKGRRGAGRGVGIEGEGTSEAGARWGRGAGGRGLGLAECLRGERRTERERRHGDGDGDGERGGRGRGEGRRQTLHGTGREHGRVVVQVQDNDGAARATQTHPACHIGNPVRAVRDHKVGRHDNTR